MVLRPAGFQKMDSTPSASLDDAEPSAVPRGPTGIFSSIAPPVPLRSSEPAHAVPPTRRVISASAMMVRNRTSRVLDCRCWTNMIVTLLEVVQTFAFHEHDHPTERGPDSGCIDVIDVHAACDRQLILRQQIPVEDRRRRVGLLQR